MVLAVEDSLEVLEGVAVATVSKKSANAHTAQLGMPLLHKFGFLDDTILCEFDCKVTKYSSKRF